MNIEKDVDLFTEGSIYYYENITNSKKDYKNPKINHDFVVSRPVYILGSNPTSFETYTVNVALITSSENRVGIPISINGYKDGKILPYTIHSFHIDNLTRYLGQVSEEIKLEMREAIKYHLGLTDIKPSYLIKHEEEEIAREKFKSSLTPKELSVYYMIYEDCEFRRDYYCKFTELYRFYEKKYAKTGYKRNCNISAAILKIIQIFPNLEVRYRHNQYYIYGMSLPKSIHKIDSSSNINTITSVANSNADQEHLIEISNMTYDQLLDTLEFEQRKIYEDLDILDKFKNYKKNPDNFNFKVVNCRNGRIIKKLMEIDVHNTETKILNQLKNGMNPHKLSHYNQYILYHIRNKEISSVINQKYIKKGIYQMKKKLKQEIRYLFKD